MGRIQLLSDEVINQIAAGEVVERPASVVKELVENSLDAGAGAIEIAVEQGGTAGIVVSDDGQGMDAGDARAAVKRHATSKITGADDLFRIGTMGFRGEALASIAAVSRFSLATWNGSDPSGLKLETDGGSEMTELPWNGPQGTTVTVRDLFFNVPAREKFLKKAATEYGHILELVQALVLCHPEVGFTLRHNDKLQLRAEPASRNEGDEAARLRQRVRPVFGDEVTERLVPIESEDRYGRVKGLVSPPGLEKGSGKFMYAFVNGRYVKGGTLRYGILRGYHSHLLKGRYPVVALHITMDPSLVDVNVHPAKTEVRFQYPSEVQSLVALAIREGLRKADWARPEPAENPTHETGPEPVGTAGGPPSAGPRGVFGGGAEISNRRAGASAAPGGRSRAPAKPESGVSRTRESFDVGEEAASFRPSRAPASVWDEASLDSLLEGGDVAGHPDELAQNTQAQQAEQPAVPWGELAYVGTFANCYLFFEHPASAHLLCVDQHALHERILFEKLTNDETFLGRSQALLVPEAVELSPTEIERLRGREAELQERGFGFSFPAETTVEVKAVPAILAGRDIAALVADLATEEPQGGDSGDNAEMARLYLATVACHAAVRAGEELPDEERRRLVADATEVDFYHNCPHGRRVFRWWSKAQVERWFDR